MERKRRMQMKTMIRPQAPLALSRALNLPLPIKKRRPRSDVAAAPLSMQIAQPRPPPPPTAITVQAVHAFVSCSDVSTSNKPLLVPWVPSMTHASAFHPYPSPFFPWASLVPSMADPRQPPRSTSNTRLPPSTLPTPSMAVLMQPTAEEREAARGLMAVSETRRFAPKDRPASSRRYQYCRCGKTKCLKLYCMCFRNDQRCTSACECQVSMLVLTVYLPRFGLPCLH